MKQKKSLLISLFLVTLVGFSSCEGGKNSGKLTDKNGYEYEMTKGDLTKSRVYTLKNGLKVYLSQNTERPKINTAIAVRVGSKDDPSATTGLAHYFEHIMFKGSDRLGTTDWPKEKVLLDSISELFERHNATDDEKEKELIYNKIDSLSYLASNYSIANEYDKAVSGLGANGTNAYTSYDRTVFIDNIPSNEVDRWLQIENERFERGVIRLFHTELETVYEEFNMGQDRDNTRAFNSLFKTIFSDHPYGRSVIGLAKDLKNPSIVNIEKFRQRYYVANNIAICMSGDLDYEKTIQSIDKYWGNLRSSPDLKKDTHKDPTPLITPKIIDLYGPEQEFLYLGFKTPMANSKDQKYLSMIDMLLSNSGAGLIDLDLVQKQKVLQGFASNIQLNDHGVFLLGGTPREGQSLDSLKTLLLEEIEKVKKGNFDDWMLQANIKQLKLSQIHSFENNKTTNDFVEAFIYDRPWEVQVNEIQEMSKITKDDIVKFANVFFQNNYCVVYKHKGENKTAIHVQKPQITSIELNRDKESGYFKQFKNKKPDNIKPLFLDFDKDINKQNLAKGIDFYYIQNTSNPLAYISVVVAMGKKNNPKLELALDYLDYLGTNKYSPEELKKEFYKLGLSLYFNTDNERSSVTVDGLDESMEDGLKLLEHVISNAKADSESYKLFIDGIIKDRQNAKTDKRTILFRGMMDYARFGPKNPFKDILSEEELRSIKPQELVDLIKTLFNYPHLVAYYGPRSEDKSRELIKKYHPMDITKTIPPAKEFEELRITKPQVYFCDYDMVQTHLVTLSRDQIYDPTLSPVSSLFAQYYGGNMSSVTFQEMREARSLAYSAQMIYRTPRKKGKYNYNIGLVFCQPDKMEDCLSTFYQLMNQMTRSETAFQNARENIISEINSQRIIKDGIFSTYLQNKDLGIDYDIRKNIYEFAQQASLDDMQKFFDNHIKNKNKVVLVLGKKELVDFKTLKQYGPVEELTLKEIFGY